MNFKEKLESYINTYDQQGYLQGNLLVADKTLKKQFCHKNMSLALAPL